MEPHTLASAHLNVTFDAPGTFYEGSRFDWTTQVRQITIGDVTFLTSEHPPSHASPSQGWGLAGEFGIETPVGYHDCPVGEQFVKIGVGLLRRPDESPYRFNRDYEVQPARFALRSEGTAALQVTADQTNSRGYGWFLKRHWSVRGLELTLATTLANTGARPLVTEEYIHNFFGIAGSPVGPGWTLTLPQARDRSELTKLVDPESLLAFDGPRLSWKKTPSQDFFLSDHRQGAPNTWSLHHADSRWSVTETTDFPAANFNLWGRSHVVSPEVYRKIEVAPGASLAWSRKWTFHRGD